MGDGYGFLRTSGYLPGENDIYVGLATIRKNGLLKGDMVTGTTRPARPNDKFAALQKVSAVNGMAPEIMALRPKFADLTPVFPDERLRHGARQEHHHGPRHRSDGPHRQGPARPRSSRRPRPARPPCSRTSPPPSQRTTRTCTSCTWASTSVPKRSTDMERSIQGRGGLLHLRHALREPHRRWPSSSFERAKRLVEQGKDVVILLDSITRLARAYNLAQPASGRILSGGVDSTALVSAQALPRRRSQHRERRLASPSSPRP